MSQSAHGGKVKPMRDRRTVDELSIEELEEVLRLRKREARLERLRRMEQTGRRRADIPAPAEMSPSESQNGRGDEPESLAYESFLYEDDGETPQRSQLRERLLLAVEIGAALTLVGVLVFAAISLRDLNREAQTVQSADIDDLPTASPTPLVSAVVLPSGHTPPTDPGGARPNYDEVPADLRPLVEQQYFAPIIQATPAPGYATTIRIPSINVEAPIVQGDGWEQLKQGVGQHFGTALPGADGNMVLSAHNDIFGEIFRRLDELSPGDEIIVESTTQTYTYNIVFSHVVTPTEVSVMAPTKDPVVTLISCYPYLVNNQRIVVVGELSE